MKVRYYLISLMVLLLLSCGLISNLESISDQIPPDLVEELIEEVAEPIIAEPEDEIEAETIVPTEDEDHIVDEPITEIQTLIEEVFEEDTSLMAAADAVILALDDRDMNALSQLVHPTLGLRFAPFALILDEYLVFMPDELPGMLDFEHQTVYKWGDYMWTGDPIELSFYDYYYRFVYSAYFIRAEEIGINEKVSPQDMINNSYEFFPGSEFVEYYFSGINPEYIGLDWQSLRLVFVEENGTWWLVCIVHEEWTG